MTTENSPEDTIVTDIFTGEKRTIGELATTRTIDLTPTPEGFVNIANMLAESILGDVKAARKADSRVLLVSFIDVVRYLAAKDAAQGNAKDATLVATLVAAIKKGN